MKPLIQRVLIALITLFIGVGVSSLFHRQTRSRTTTVSKPELVRACSWASPVYARLEHSIPQNWYKVYGGGFFSFYLPTNVRLSSDERSDRENA